MFGRLNECFSKDSSVTDDRDDDLATPWFDVAFEVENLLPCSQHRRATRNRNRDRGANRGRLQVRVAISVVPSFFMTVVAAWRHQAIKHGRIVLFESRLELDRSDRTGAAHIENTDRANLNTAFADDLRHLTGDVVHLSMMAGCELDPLLNHQWDTPDNDCRREHRFFDVVPE